MSSRRWPGLDTASYDALEAAFAFRRRGDLLSVRRRADQRQVSCAPADIINVITLGNRSRRESIYTIGLAPGLPDSPMEWFMKTLAEQNAGHYRRVDQ